MAGGTIGDCGIRCFNERKTYCRDLHKWGRNLLYMIGLEQVSKQMTDRRSWPSISPFLSENPATDATKSTDWDSTDICPICAGRRSAPLIQSDSMEMSSSMVVELDRKQPHDDLSSSSPKHQHLINFDNLFSAVSDPIQSSNAFAQLFAAPTPHHHHMFSTPMPPPLFGAFGGSSAAYLQQLFQWSSASTGGGGGGSVPVDRIFNWNPYLNAAAMLPNVIAAAAAAEHGAAFVSTHNQPVMSQPSRRNDDIKEQQHLIAYPMLIDDAQPLDLSRKPTKSDPDVIGTCRLPVATTTNGTTPIKRAYSQADLEMAVKDIRCGKLGTRRASVVYGIPRSTLRNKIYKLEAAEEQQHSNGDSAPMCKQRSMRRGGVNVRISTSPLITSHPTSIHQMLDSPASDRSDQSSAPPPPQPSSSALSWDHFGQASAAATSDWSLWSSLVRQQQQHPQSMVAPFASGGNECVKEKSAESQSPANSTSSGGGNGAGNGNDWKRQRPKRGQYRRYDKDALDEAVQSVRRGEMSVHRAGSYYGVPHSTLEYKVKERNLLRAKKRQLIQPKSVGSADDSDGGGIIGEKSNG